MYMRWIIFAFVAVLGAGCAGSKHTASSDKGAATTPAKQAAVKAPKNASLNGLWVPVRQEMNGAEMPASAYMNQSLIIDGNTYTVNAESVDKGELKYKDGKMDIYGKEGPNAHKHFTAIYKYENELLTICYNISGESYPTAFETKSHPMLFLSVFKKMQ
jgi:uncharacterized protein (TIGR03067 family)